jgi:hypothetical protein
METRDLERIRFTTRHFNDLQGLRYEVPLGMAALGGGLALLGWGGPLLLAAGLLGAFTLWLGAKRYYASTFGAVEQAPPDPAAELYPASVFSPAGPIPRLEGAEPVPPRTRRFLATLALAMVLFSILQALPPRFRVDGRESLGQHPRIALLPLGALERPWIVGEQRQPTGIVQPAWVPWVYSRTPVRPASMLRAVFAQTAYLLFGCFFLSLWLWRGRHPSQSHQLTLAAALLGLAALGASLGFLVQRAGAVPPLLDRLLPALVYPGWALLLCGAAMVLAGLLDHRQLARNSRPSPAL